MGSQRLPEEVVTALNDLGFALVGGEESYTFLRLGPIGVFRVVVAPTETGCWRVELATRMPNEAGHLPNPFLSVPLQGLPDGGDLLLSAAELVEDLPRRVESALAASEMACG